MKNVIKSSDSLDSNILSPTEEFPSNSRWGFFRYLTGMAPVTSTLSTTEEFRSHFWSNFSTIWPELAPDTLTLSPTKEFPSNFLWSFFHCLNRTNPRYFDDQAISLSLRCQIHTVRTKQKFVQTSRTILCNWLLLLKSIWRIYRLH
jgi:hypothetical protein